MHNYIPYIFFEVLSGGVNSGYLTLVAVTYQEL